MTFYFKKKFRKKDRKLVQQNNDHAWIDQMRLLSFVTDYITSLLCIQVILLNENLVFRSYVCVYLIRTYIIFSWS